VTLRLHNSLTKQKEEFVPLEPGKVRMYSCGVTVYDKCHIGHARSLYVIEVLRRYLKHRGYEVYFVRNITDVDDKIINKANETKRTFDQVVKENIELYYHDLDLLGIPPADKEPRATENIDIMIDHIQGLIDKGMAYASGGDVYFRVREFKEYGKLSGQSVDQMKEAVRISKEEKKEDPLDFALWKSSKENEPSWDSPWGPGRPGWHIECSCMSMKHLNAQTLDIHAGGRDLIFPHHENEVAQSEGLTGKPFAKYWVHNGLLTINGQKMAKSLGNFITVEDLANKYLKEDIKMFFLMTHYSSPIDFSDEKVAEAHKAMNKIRQVIIDAQEIGALPGDGKGPQEEWVASFRTQIKEAMDDDLNSPRTLGVVFDLISQINKQRDQEDYAEYLQTGAALIKRLFNEVFGIADFKNTTDQLKEEGLDKKVESLVEERRQAREQKNFQRSDEIRDELLEIGVVVEDTKDGQKWRMV